MADKQTRGYSDLSDSLMLQEAGSTQSIFVDDQAVFEAFDVDYGGTYATDFETAIGTAAVFPTDEQIRDEISDLGQLTEDEMEKCRENFQDAKRFIKKAWPDRPKMWNRFGFDDYNDARASKHKLIPFMERYLDLVNDFTAELTAVNFTAAMQTEVGTRANALISASKTEKKKEKERGDITNKESC